MYELETEIFLPRPLDEVFAFFADARNLEEITPPFLSFSVITEGEIDMQPGTMIDYRLRVRGVPLRWQSEITAWNPPRRFAMTWHVGRSEEEASQIDVRFEDSPTGCTIHLRHDGWEVHGTAAANLRENYNTGWDGVLTDFAARAADT